MELRHLRYFVAVAEEGSFTTAAEGRLHTSQPSLSRQIRDLEYEVGAELLSRSVHGVELTAAGKAFLDHGHEIAEVSQLHSRSMPERYATQLTKSFSRPPCEPILALMDGGPARKSLCYQRLFMSAGPKEERNG